MGVRARFRVTAISMALLMPVFAWSQDDSNLLTNGGFEEVDGDEPIAWTFFVQPSEGARAWVDDELAASGDRSVALAIAQPYAEEPYNNWSQNLLEDFSGEELVLKGRIRTERAQSASLWIQCWRADPWSVLKVANTADSTPVKGTRDWTSVQTKLKVPADTDYITVRCVLTGTGKAWFDDISLAKVVKEEPANEEKKEEETAEKAVAKPEPPKKPAKPVPPKKGPDEEKSDELAYDETEAALADTKSSDASVRELINANRVLMEGYQALKETNEELAKQIKSLTNELNSLRRQLDARNTARPAPAPAAGGGTEKSPPAIATAPASPPRKPEPPAPPLVPSGEDWQKSLQAE